MAHLNGKLKIKSTSEMSVIGYHWIQKIQRGFINSSSGNQLSNYQLL